MQEAQQASIAALVNEAIRRGSTDNVTCIALFFSSTD